MNNNFSISSKATSDVVVIIPNGYVNDLGAVRLEHECEQFLHKGLRKLVINFSNMQYINSIGASVLTGIVHEISEYRAYLCFTNVKKIHLDVFEILGITKHVRIFKDEEEALSFLKNLN
ncbi:MAG: STAS domain-containing protein [Nitrospirae bacterium]|nr:STAS domain-containing protein [Nitrospirota bacterium]